MSLTHVLWRPLAWQSRSSCTRRLVICSASFFSDVSFSRRDASTSRSALRFCIKDNDDINCDIDTDRLDRGDTQIVTILDIQFSPLYVCGKRTHERARTRTQACTHARTYARTPPSLSLSISLSISRSLSLALSRPLSPSLSLSLSLPLSIFPLSPPSLSLT